MVSSNEVSPVPDYYQLKPTVGYLISNVTVPYNSTLAGSDQQNRSLIDWIQDIGLGAMLVLLCLLTVLGNTMVLYAVRTERSLQTVSITDTSIVLPCVL